MYGSRDDFIGYRASIVFSAGENFNGLFERTRFPARHKKAVSVAEGRLQFVQFAPAALFSNRLGAEARARSRQRAKISVGDSHCSANAASACASLKLMRRMIYFTSSMTGGAVLR